VHFASLLLSDVLASFIALHFPCSAPTVLPSTPQWEQRYQLRQQVHNFQLGHRHFLTVTILCGCCLGTLDVRYQLLLFYDVLSLR